MAVMRQSTCTPPRGVFIAEASANDRLCQEHYRLGLVLDSFPPTRPGQFVQLQCRGLGQQVDLCQTPWPPGRPPRLSQPELTDAEPLLRRPFSIAGRRDRPSGGVELDIIYRVKGAGTRWLERLRPGQRLSVLGPLGNAFALRPEKPLAALVGGGVGIPPMIYLASALAGRGAKAVAFCGVRTRAKLPLTLAGAVEPPAAAHPTQCAAELAAVGVESVLATDDGSLGFPGPVSEALRHWLNAHDPSPAELVVYACGPEAMMRAVADICLSRRIECQLALERHMACGMGTCQSCVVKIRDGSQRGWSFKLCCTDGPVFEAGQIVW